MLRAWCLFLCIISFFLLAIQVKGEIECEVEMHELYSEDPDSLKERITRLQDQVLRQEEELERLRKLILESDCNAPSLDQASFPSITTSSESDEEISLVWTVDELEADGFSASLNSVLQHTLPSAKRRIHVYLLVDKAIYHTIPFWLFPQLHDIYGSGEYNGTVSLKTWPFRITMKEYNPGMHYEKAERWIVHGSHYSHLDKDISFARLYIKDYFPNLGKILFLQNDVIVKRDLNDIWSILLIGTKKLFGAFRNCQTGYKHYFDVYNPTFIEAGIQDCKCAFSSAIFAADLDLWVANDIPKQLNFWLTSNMNEPIYFGAATAPLLAVFYDNYQNFAGIHMLGWNHYHSLGIKQMHHNNTLIDEAHSIDWDGKSKPWLLSGHTYSSYWSPYALNSPSYRKFKEENLKKRQETIQNSEKVLMARMREAWADDFDLNAEGSQSGSLLVLVSMLSIVMLIILAYLHFQSPKQHQYEKKQIRKLNANLYQTKVVKKISYVIE